METKIAKILSNTVVVLGAGTSAGVRPGMEFTIYEIGEEIFDPETKESLGRLEVVKGAVTAIDVQQMMTTAKVIPYTVNKTRTVPLWPHLLMHREENVEIERIEKLKIENSDPTYEKSLTVRVGDRARSKE